MPWRLVSKCLAVLLSQGECLAHENMSTRLPDATYCGTGRKMEQNFTPGLCVCNRWILKTQWNETHRFRRPGTVHRSIDHPVTLDRAFGSLPPYIQSVGSRVENLNVPDWASLHCRTSSDRWLRSCVSLEVKTEIRKWKVGLRVRERLRSKTVMRGQFN